MLIMGIVISAVAMFLGLVTKLPQGGGGLVNSLMTLTFLLPAPPLPPLPLKKGILLDLETAIAENQLFYLGNPVVTRNGTYGPVPRLLQNPRSATYGKNASSSNDSASNATFTFPTFSFSAFSPPEELTEFWESIAVTIMVFLTLCLPWLLIKKMNLLDNAGPALPAASRPMLIGFGEKVSQIEPISPLLQDLRITISEHDRAVTNLRSTIKEAREAKKEAAEKDAKKEEIIERMRFELNRALAELEKGKEMVAKVEEEKKKKIDEVRDKMLSQMEALEEKAAKLAEEGKREVDGLREEKSREIKAWAEKVAILEEEKRRETDRLRKEISNQRKARMEIKEKWEEDRADKDVKHNEAINSLKMGKEQEIGRWRKQVENLKGAEEASVSKLKNILEKTEKKKVGWEIQKEEWMEEKKVMARVNKEVEEKREEERKSWVERNDSAQRRIVDLEAETQRLNDKVADGQKKAAKAEAEMETAKAQKEQGQEEAKKSIAKLKEEVLNGRKLIEGLQADKRRDRQLLLELRAQYVRPTHANPPSLMNPLRFAGSAPPPFMREPRIAGSTSVIPPTGSSSFRATNPSAFPIAYPPSAGFAPQTVSPLPSQILSPRPIIRLPPSNPAQPPPATTPQRGE